ncbi:MAG: gamma-glutamyl-gamma-aminobutyrate hydrolase family protein [Polyangiaceae bacterium]|nr:gamma-glutamyl-gamma-aminobutyrate hydrolase family protein [Polyangiaceae bacterium]
MSRGAVALQHVPFEGPARLAGAFARAGARLEVVRLCDGAAVPASVETGTALVVLGGPMGVSDLDDPRWPFLRAELALVEQRVRLGEPVLGVCLGAQLIAHAAGARVYPNTRLGAGGARERAPEVGWGEVRFPRGAHPVTRAVAEREPMFHWHGDTFDLPAGATLFASTDSCAHQAFAIGERCFGLQFHCEADRDSIDALLAADADFARAALGEGAAEQIRSDTARYEPSLRASGDRLLDALVTALLA